VDVLLETDRLILRRFTMADEDNLVALDGDPEVMHYLTGGKPTPREVVRSRVLPHFLASYDRSPGFGTWAALEKSSGQFLGWFGFNPPDAGQPENVELGYRLRRATWGKGYATEGTRALIRRGFQELRVTRVFATTYEDNLASRRVMEKLGMSLVRRFHLTVDNLVAKDTFDGTSSEVWNGDDVEYVLTKEAWLHNRPSDVTLDT
jgi:RimJ/RimL family protein N-acetyltransferase